MACTSTTLALEMPTGFDCTTFDAVNTIVGKYVQTHPRQWSSFASGWNGVGYRYRASTEYDAKFRRLIVDTAPPPPQRYAQETTLYAFCALAISTVESFIFAAYCFASLVAVRSGFSAFPITKKGHLRFNVWDVLEQFEEHYPTETLTSTMRSCLEESEHVRIRGLRNVLTHRGTIPRRVFLAVKSPQDRSSAVPSNPTDVATRWKYNAPLSEHTTGDAMAWLTRDLATLLAGAHAFCAAKL